MDGPQRTTAYMVLLWIEIVNTTRIGEFDHDTRLVYKF